MFKIFTMRSIRKISLVVLFLYGPVSLFAQKELPKLTCPFEHGSGREPKEAFSWQPRDEKIIMMSQVDTLIRSVVTGTVSNVSPTEDNSYEIVVYYKNLYFWYYGVAKPWVKKGQNVTAGQTIGTYKFGTELELRMFKDEEPMDPRNLLECKIPKADD